MVLINGHLRAFTFLVSSPTLAAWTAKLRPSAQATDTTEHCARISADVCPPRFPALGETNAASSGLMRGATLRRCSSTRWSQASWLQKKKRIPSTPTTSEASPGLCGQRVSSHLRLSHQAYRGRHTWHFLQDMSGERATVCILAC